MVRTSNGDIDDQTPFVVESFTNMGGSYTQNVDSFWLNSSNIENNIYIVDRYSPKTITHINKRKGSTYYTLGDLVSLGALEIRRGHEVGSKFYGTGDIPFIRTTDVVNWEIKSDTTKMIGEEAYQIYKNKQDVKDGDILIVNDGTFLIGNIAMIMENDVKCVYQSQLKKLRVVGIVTGKQIGRAHV